MKIPIANIYYLFAYAWGKIKEAEIISLNELPEFDEVHDLLGKVLAMGVFRLARSGLDRGYLEVEEDLRGIRGKLLLNEMAKRALKLRSRATCQFEELSTNVLHNQILFTSLKRLLTIENLDAIVRSDVRLAFKKLHGIDPIDLSQRAFSHVQLDRNRRTYAFLLNICELLYQQSLLSESEGIRRFLDIRRDEYTMSSIFEKFTINFYTAEQSRFRVNEPKRVITWDKQSTSDSQAKFIPGMEADVILESDDQRIILDTKYYEQALSDSGKLRSANLYQLLAYIRNRQNTTPYGPKHEGILLYPTVNRKIDIEVCLEGHRIRARSVDLGQVNWRDIHDQLLGIIEE